MGDDEAELEPEPIRPLISKRKAADDSFSTRRKNKLPRLDLNGVRPPPSSTSPSGSTDTGHASRTQPAQPSKQKNFKAPFLPDQNRAQSTSSGTSTPDFPSTLSQLVHQANIREKEKEKERTQDGRRGPSLTARKQTVQTRNVRKVNTASLLRNVQRPSALFFSLVLSSLLIQRLLHGALGVAPSPIY